MIDTCMCDTWITLGAPYPNTVLNKIDKDTNEAFYISYNQHPPSIFGCSLEETTITSPETALVLRVLGEEHMHTFLILLGDFRKEYEACSTVKACLKVFKENLKSKSEFSDDI